MKKVTAVINLKGVLTLVIILAIIDLSVAFLLAPVTTRFVQEAINRHTPARIIVEGVKFHPALLSLGISRVQVYDPEDHSRIILQADGASARLSILSLLKRRAGLAHLTLDRVQAEAVRDASGRFNFEKLAEPESKSKWDNIKDALSFKKKMDGFGNAYDKYKKFLKKKESEKSGIQKVYEARVAELPRGRLVSFESPSDPVFEVGRIQLKNADIVVQDAGKSLPPFRNVSLVIKGFRREVSGNTALDAFTIKGEFEASKKGSFDIRFDDDKEGVTSSARIQNLDLGAYQSLYAESLPVSFSRGWLTLDNDTRSSVDQMRSRNHLILEDYTLAPGGKLSALGVAAGPVMNALNSRSKLELKFEIGGTPERPDLGVFQKELMKSLGVDIESMLKQGLEQGITKDTVNQWSEKIKSLF